MYLNSANTDITEYLDFNPPYLRIWDKIERSFHICLVKNVTALEACQFLNTMLFEVRISCNTHLQNG